MTDASTADDRTPTSTDHRTDRVHRRTALRAGAATVAATAAAVVATSSSASAAAGQAVVQGGSNVVGTPTTFLSSSGGTPTLQVRNTGSGAAAFFFGQNNNGFAGGTAGANRYGLSAANTGAAGGGAGMAASGGNNSGVLANTTNPERFAVAATHLGASSGDAGAAVLADGGLNAGVVASTTGVDMPALVVGGPTVAFADTFLAGGALAQTVTASDVTLYGVVSAERPALTFAGVAVLVAGAVDITLPPTVIADADMSDASVVVTPRSGAMPNLFATVSQAGVVTISGGVGSGTVNYQVTLHQPVQTAARAATTVGGGTLLARARAVVAGDR